MMYGLYVIPILYVPQYIFRPYMLIDWLTLRHPLTPKLGRVLHEKIMSAMGCIVQFDPSGVMVWEKRSPDWEAIRSDSVGLYWAIQSDGKQEYLVIGASPSSLLNAGVNVFGSLDLKYGCEVVINRASKALEAVLPNWLEWDLKRMDITANYDMGAPAQVKQGLKLLLSTDAPRRKSNSDKRGGDSVYWSPLSALRSGKAYHKGAHLRYLQKKGKIEISDDHLLLADNLIRLELKLGSMWFRRYKEKADWHNFTEKDLATIHYDYFKSLIGGGDVEVYDMGTLLIELEKVSPTKGRALAAHRTWALIKTIGYTQTSDSMNKNTFAKHCVYLRAAGLSSADLCAATIIPFRMKSLILNQPVNSWEEIRRAA